jgi:hypothetical protein
MGLTMDESPIDKRCFKCGRTLPIDEFHRHHAMADGHLNKCKDCACADTRRHYRETIGERREYERKRSRRQDRLVKKHGYERKHRATYPEKYRARMAIRNAIRAGRLIRPDRCESCGKECTPEAHHDDYRRALEVRWLCFSCHRREHGQEVE